MHAGCSSAGASATSTSGIASPDPAARSARSPSASLRNRSGAQSSFHFANQSPRVVRTRTAWWMQPPPTGSTSRTAQRGVAQRLPQDALQEVRRAPARAARAVTA